ncbi:jg12604 [Pararge aegeria aegeria]|uniref:Jg12604 protein n=1 Tax=Pararge aegeria aegeria TaxID=348720 RepID=A0A8S4SE78_9NEOP|nr:jg12604 [Pararge aegeria aegeria]
MIESGPSEHGSQGLAINVHGMCVPKKKCRKTYRAERRILLEKRPTAKLVLLYSYDLRVSPFSSDCILRRYLAEGRANPSGANSEFVLQVDDYLQMNLRDFQLKLLIKLFV